MPEPMQTYAGGRPDLGSASVSAALLSVPDLLRATSDEDLRTCRRHLLFGPE